MSCYVLAHHGGIQLFFMSMLSLSILPALGRKLAVPKVSKCRRSGSIGCPCQPTQSRERIGRLSAIDYQILVLAAVIGFF